LRDGNALAGEPVITPNEFSGPDAERINRAIEEAAAHGGRVVIPRVNNNGEMPREIWLLDSAILLRNNTTLELDNCRIKLSDRCRDNLMRSANCGLGISDIHPLRNIHIRGVGKVELEGADHPRATGDSGKTLGKSTYGTDAGVAGESQTGDWRNIGILLAFVEDFSIQNLAVKDSHCWAISLERCASGTVRDVDFASAQDRMIDGVRQTILNQDGVDLRMGCHDILIENITGYTGDDMIALTAIPQPGSRAGSTVSTMVSGSQDRGQGLDDIRNVTIRNIKGYCRGGHHIVRLLNTPGSSLHDVVLDGLTDTSPPDKRCRAALKIGDRNYGGGIAPMGSTTRITIRNITSRSQHAVLVAGTLSDSTISNVIHRGTAAEPVTLELGPQAVRNVTISDVRTVAD
jgi:polygalacturonase